MCDDEARRRGELLDELVAIVSTNPLLEGPLTWEGAINRVRVLRSEAGRQNLTEAERQQAQAAAEEMWQRRATADAREVEARREEARDLRVKVARLETTVHVLREECDKRAAELREMAAETWRAEMERRVSLVAEERGKRAAESTKRGVALHYAKVDAIHREILLDRIKEATDTESWDAAVAAVEAMCNRGDGPDSEE